MFVSINIENNLNDIHPNGSRQLNDTQKYRETAIVRYYIAWRFYKKNVVGNVDNDKLNIDLLISIGGPWSLNWQWI